MAQITGRYRIKGFGQETSNIAIHVSCRRRAMGGIFFKGKLSETGRFGRGVALAEQQTGWRWIAESCERTVDHRNINDKIPRETTSVRNIARPAVFSLHFLDVTTYVLRRTTARRCRSQGIHHHTSLPPLLKRCNLLSLFDHDARMRSS